MTFEDRQPKKTRRGKGLRFLDLSFQGEHAPKYSTTSNAFRTTSGSYKGRTEHPPSQYSFNKPPEYHQQLREDMDNMFEEESHSQSGTPSYVHAVSRQVVHSGESPLFTNKLLAPSRIEQRNGQIQYHKALLQPNKFGPPPKTKKGMYYRPNQAHQYLTATELRDAASGEIDVKLGKPTRATLLRARSKRCSSAQMSATSYQTARDTQRQADVTRPKSAPRRLNTFKTPDGESIHAFLTGARYNRAHYLDTKSLFHYGIYMPRSNPGQSFYVEKLLPKDNTKKVSEESVMLTSSPAFNSRGSSPCDSDSESLEERGTPPCTAAQPPSRPKTSLRGRTNTAWDAGDNSGLDDETPPNHHQMKVASPHSHDVPTITTLQPVLMEIPIKVRGLSVRANFNAAKLRGAKYMRYTSDQLPPSSPSSARKYPEVFNVQGKAVTRTTGLQDNRDEACQNESRSGYMSRPSSPSVDENLMEMRQDIVEYYKQENMPLKKTVRIQDPAVTKVGQGQVHVTDQTDDNKVSGSVLRTSGMEYDHTLDEENPESGDENDTLREDSVSRSVLEGRYSRLGTQTPVTEAGTTTTGPKTDSIRDDLPTNATEGDRDTIPVTDEPQSDVVKDAMNSKEEIHPSANSETLEINGDINRPAYIDGVEEKQGTRMNADVSRSTGNASVEEIQETMMRSVTIEGPASTGDVIDTMPHDDPTSKFFVTSENNNDLDTVLPSDMLGSEKLTSDPGSLVCEKC